MFSVGARITSVLAVALKGHTKPHIFTRNLVMLSDKIAFASENTAGDCPAVLIKAKDTKSTRGLVVLQEWWGLNQQIQDEASGIAENGDFVALVPDLYRGKVAIDHETAGHYMNDLDWPGAVEDIRGAAKFLLSNGCTKVGVTGFCMGGALTFASAALVKEICAAAPFYGIPGEGLCDISKIKIPLQCHFGSLDELVGFSSPQDVEALKEKFAKAGKLNYEVFMYDANHAFTNSTSENYNQAATTIALKRMVEFMQNNLQE